MVSLERAGEARVAVVGDVDGVVLRLEAALDEARDLPLVLDDQDAHTMRGEPRPRRPG